MPGDHNGDVQTINLDFTNYLGTNYQTKSTNGNVNSIAHKTIEDGYTVIIKDAYVDGDFKDLEFNNVNISTTIIHFEAIEWVGIEVFHPVYDKCSSYTEAYYSVNIERMGVAGDVLEIPLEFTQAAIYLITNNSIVWAEEIKTANINDVTVSESEIVYVPADTEFSINIEFNDGQTINLSERRSAGTATYYTISKNAIDNGIEFKLPVFEDPNGGTEIIIPIKNSIDFCGNYIRLNAGRDYKLSDVFNVNDEITLEELLNDSESVETTIPKAEYVNIYTIDSANTKVRHDITNWETGSLKELLTRAINENPQCSENTFRLNYTETFKNAADSTITLVRCNIVTNNPIETAL